MNLRCLRVLAFALLAATTPGAGTVGAQPPARRATVVEAIRAHPGFFHGQAVAVVGTVGDASGGLALASDTGSIRIAARESIPSGPAEIRGMVLDVGRLTPDDPRLLRLGLIDALRARYGDGWPRPGEELVIAVSSAAPPSPHDSVSAPAIRALALAPDRFAGERVTVVGQFRGRNLYGDTPQAPPAAGRTDFVLRAGDGAVWVTGLRPRGPGFTLDPARRVDTGRWLRVSGKVRHAGGIVWIEGASLAPAEAPAEAVVDVEVPAPPAAPIDVLFSAPTAGEIDVDVATTVRIQFSRDIDPTSLDGRVRARYEDAAGQGRDATGDAAHAIGPDIELTVSYAPALRALEIGFASPLQAFRRVAVHLDEGIVGTDGATLAPWSLTFRTGAAR